MPRRRVFWIALAGLTLLIVGVAIAAGGGGSSSSPNPDDVPAAQITPGAQTDEAPLPPGLKHHPKVVIAAAPGDPAFTYASNPDEAENFVPPSDAEVKRELHELNVSKLGGDGTYANPFQRIKDLRPERIDMGVDYGGSGIVVALGSGTVFNVKGPGWPGGIFIGITLDEGPFAGLSYFLAEDVRPGVHVGDHVVAGQPIARMYSGSAGIETGWAAGRGDQPLASALNQENKRGDPGGWTSAAGLSFDRVLVSTGAPSGIPQGTKVHGKMPDGYP